MAISPDLPESPSRPPVAPGRITPASPPGKIGVIPIRTPTPVQTGGPGKIGVVPIAFTPVNTVPASIPTYKPSVPSVPGKITPQGTGNPANPNTTGLGSQVVSDLEGLFGSGGSQGISGGTVTNGKGVLSTVPNIVWILLVLGAGYFLLMD
jgi:hypothetical protein